MSGDDPAARGPLPSGEPYDWFVRGNALLEGGNPDAAVELLRRAQHAEPQSTSVLETLARALFDARRFLAAESSFAQLVDAAPDNDYARFGLGLSRFRRGDVAGAVEQLALAVAMAPHRPAYSQALREARATLRAREAAVGDVAGEGVAGEGAPGGDGTS